MEQINTPLRLILPFVIPLLLLQLILMISALVDLRKREKVRWIPKWGWVIVIILGELIGPILYFVLGREE